MLTITVLAGATCAAALITGARVFTMRKLVQHSTKTDVLFTGVVAFGLAGTLTGLAAAIIAGLMMAVVLSALKCLYGLADAAQEAWQGVKHPSKPAPAGMEDEYVNGVWIYNTAEMV